MNEKELIRDCIKGSKIAWNTFAERYSNFIYHVILDTLNSQLITYIKADLEDIFGDVLYALVKNDFRLLRQYDSQYSFTNWLGMITRAKSIDYFRKKGASHTVPFYKYGDEEDRQDEPAGTALFTEQKTLSPSSNTEKAELVSIIRAVLKDISAKDRMVIKLFFYEDKKYREIAQMLNMTTGIVASIIYRAKEKVAERLKELGIDSRIVNEG
ncbi:MAG: hypothetical protein A2W23_07875 [Planctomycetes bacterium RBG_16_43_13]|nr:MAG: hypothetical protein A2W23_07875 [Planctomycetes bacterium RBG_16_43_13]